MDNTKCFCHFNGFEVKDAKARKSITNIETELIAVNENANNLDTKIEENKSSMIVINEEVANVKENVSSNSYDIGVIATGLNTANSNITKNESDISNLNTNLETTNNNVTNNANNINSLSEQINNIHTHDNKDILDSITAEKIENWDLGNGNVYLLDEQIVGKYLGKNLYKRTFTGTINGEYAGTYFAQIKLDNGEKFERVIDSKGFLSDTTGIDGNLFDISYEGVFPVKYSNGNIEFRAPQMFYNKYFEVTLYYTKTTDVVESEV